MSEAIIAVAFVFAAAVIGFLLKPTEDQLRPLSPQASAGEAAHDHHH